MSNLPAPLSETGPRPTQPVRLTPASTVAPGGTGSPAEKLLANITQHQTNLARQGATPGEQVAALGGFISLMASPKNQPFLKQLGASTLEPLQQAALQAVQTYHRQLPALVSEAFGLDVTATAYSYAEAEKALHLKEEEAEDGNEVEDGNGSGLENGENSSKPRRLTRAKIVEMVNAPIDPQTYNRLTGWKRTTPTYIFSSDRIPLIMQLLAEYGALSVYQLTALLGNQDAHTFGVNRCRFWHGSGRA